VSLAAAGIQPHEYLALNELGNDVAQSAVIAGERAALTLLCYMPVAAVVYV